MGCCYAPVCITVYTLCMCPHLNLTIPGANRTQQRSDPPGATAAEEGWGHLGPRGGVCFSLSQGDRQAVWEPSADPEAPFNGGLHHSG